MLRQECLQQEVIDCVQKTLTFDVPYQKIRPDISPFIVVTSMLSLRGLDDWERLIRTAISSSVHQPRPEHKMTEKQPIGSLKWMDLCHANGYRREKALRVLAGSAPNRFLLALLVRRLNDWVAQVRAAARDALPAIIEASDADSIVDVLFVTLPYWNSWERMEDIDKDALMKVISSEKVTAALLKRLITSSSGPVATLFMQAGRSSVLDRFLADIAEKSVQPALRAKAFRCLLEGKFVWTEGTTWQWVDKVYGVRKRIPVLKERALSTLPPFSDMLRMAAVDRSPRVRRIAGEMLIKELDRHDEAFGLATILASDKSASVAERGRYALNALKQRR